jgi:hypothetical protein
MRRKVVRASLLSGALSLGDTQHKRRPLMTTAEQTRNGWWWSPSDLVFLRDALERGMTLAEAAGFLSRDEDEVRKKAKQMQISYGRLPRYSHYRLRRRG